MALPEHPWFLEMLIKVSWLAPDITVTHQSSYVTLELKKNPYHVFIDSAPFKASWTVMNAHRERKCVCVGGEIRDRGERSLKEVIFNQKHDGGC